MRRNSSSHQSLNRREKDNFVIKDLKGKKGKTSIREPQKSGLKVKKKTGG